MTQISLLRAKSNNPAGSRAYRSREIPAPRSFRRHILHTVNSNVHALVEQRVLNFLDENTLHTNLIYSRLLKFIPRSFYVNNFRLHVPTHSQFATHMFRLPRRKHASARSDAHGRHVSPGPNRTAAAPLPNPPPCDAILHASQSRDWIYNNASPIILPPAAKSVRAPPPKYFPLTPVARAKILLAPAPSSARKSRSTAVISTPDCHVWNFRMCSSINSFHSRNLARPRALVLLHNFDKSSTLYK